jgi:ATP-dependent Clp protease protease subunit
MSESPTDENDSHHFIHGDIDQKLAAEVVEFIVSNNLRRVKPKKLVIWITSNGGEVESAFAIVDAMRLSTIPITTWGIGVVASSALMILMAGSVRYLTENTVVMSHQFDTDIGGKYHELVSAVSGMEITKRLILKHYSRYTDLSDDVIKGELLPPHDVWLTADDAVRYNLADSVLGRLS